MLKEVMSSTTGVIDVCELLFVWNCKSRQCPYLLSHLSRHFSFRIFLPCLTNIFISLNNSCSLGIYSKVYFLFWFLWTNSHSLLGIHFLLGISLGTITSELVLLDELCCLDFSCHFCVTPGLGARLLFVLLLVFNFHLLLFLFLFQCFHYSRGTRLLQVSSSQPS